MWRFKFTDSNIKQAIKYLKTDKGPKPTYIKDSLSPKVVDGMLELKGKKVLPPSKIQSTLEKIVKSGKAPLTRDSLYAYLQKQYVNIRRAPVDNFLRSQSWITDTSNRRPRREAVGQSKRKAS